MMAISPLIHRTIRIMLLLVVGISIFAVSTPAAAVYAPYGKVDCSKVKDGSAVCSRGAGDPITGPNGIIRKVTQIIAILAGAAAVIIIVLSGIRYITSAGDAEGVSRAKKTIIFAAVGLIVIATGQAIINFVLNRI